MAVTRQIKEKALAKANEIFENSEAAVFVHFSGVSGEDTRKMRAGMEKEGVKYSVIKKTLIKNAGEASKVSGDMPELNGEIAIAYSDTDASAPGRLVKEFSSSLKKDMVSIEGGFFEGKFKNKSEMVEIANIPSLDVLRGMFVNIINSPIQRTAIALSEIAKSKA
jgi:large subunit ribosomal protein L10